MRSAGLLFFLCFCCPLFAAVQADLFIPMEAGTNTQTLTSTLANSSAVTTNTFTWTMYQNQAGALTVCSNQYNLLGYVSIGGTQYNGTGSHGWLIDRNVRTNFIEARFAASKSNVSVGYFLAIGVGTTFGSYNDSVYIGGEGDFAILALVDDPSTPHFVLETTSPDQTSIPCVSNKLYWVTMKYASGDKAYLNIYDGLTGQLIAATNAPMTDGITCNRIRIGRSDAHAGLTPNTYSYIDNFIMDYSAAQFPLFPNGGFGQTLIGNAMLSGNTRVGQ